MRTNAAVQTDLHDDTSLAGGLHHGLAFVDGVPCRFFDIDMRTRLACGNGLQCMPVVGSGDDDDFGLLFVEKFAVVLVELRVVAGEAVDRVTGVGGHVFMHIAQSANLDAARGQRLF